MRAITVLFGASIGSTPALRPVLKGQSALALALKHAAAFPGSEKTLLLTKESEIPGFPPSLLAEQRVSTLQKPVWTVSDLLETVSKESAGYDFAYYAWADTPFLDPALAGRIAERHIRFAAEYSYADGWPGGLGPELITGAAAGILYKIAGEAGKGPVRRDSLFTVLQKDINSFDIETEISAVDLRHLRLSLSADSKRNLLLLERLAEPLLPDAAGTEGIGGNYAETIAGIIAGKPEYLRTLPAFFPIQVSGPCPKN